MLKLFRHLFVIDVFTQLVEIRINLFLLAEEFYLNSYWTENISTLKK